MPQTQMASRNTDAKGRITLGERFANRTVLIEDHGDEVLIRLARVIPERELWLYRNKKALAQVMDGLESARADESVPGPDMGRARQVAGLDVAGFKFQSAKPVKLKSGRRAGKP